MAELEIREATVIRPGDHLIVRVEDAHLTQADVARYVQELKERMPLLSDVTVVYAAGLSVFRDEVSNG